MLLFSDNKALEDAATQVELSLMPVGLGHIILLERWFEKHT